jgi:hypothetical protein
MKRGANTRRCGDDPGRNAAFKDAYAKQTFPPPGWAHMHPTHEEDPVSASPRARRALALLLAGGALAVGVPAVLAAGGGDESAATTGAPSVQQSIQDEQRAPDGRDCPERDGSGGGGSSTAPDANAEPSV